MTQNSGLKGNLYINILCTLQTKRHNKTNQAKTN